MGTDGTVESETPERGGAAQAACERERRLGRFRVVVYMAWILAVVLWMLAFWKSSQSIDLCFLTAKQEQCQADVEAAERATKFLLVMAGVVSASAVALSICAVAAAVARRRKER